MAKRVASLLVFPAGVTVKRVEEIMQALQQGRLPGNLNPDELPLCLGAHEFDPACENVALYVNPGDPRPNL